MKKPEAKGIARLMGRSWRTVTQVFRISIVVSSIAPFAYGADCNMISVGLTPINDLGTGTYNGIQGGLYPGGSNVRPASHEQAGLTLARSIEPLDSNGVPDQNGKYVLLSIGMSNASQEFGFFVLDADADPGKDRDLVVVNGAQGGATAADWADESNPVWIEAMQRLSLQGVNANQVVTLWLKLANSANGQTADRYRIDLQSDMEGVAGILNDKFPNLKLAYFSSRIYAGYATTALNPEPFAYESGFVTKRTIEKQLNGEILNAPWLSWGPYMWADGLTPRNDGLIWECDDLRDDDGTHPSDVGKQKVASMLLDFFKTDAIAKEWFLGGSGEPADIVAPAAPQNLVVEP